MNRKTIILCITFLFAIPFASMSQWTKCKGEFAKDHANNFVKVEDKILSGTKKGIIVSRDGGISWNEKIPTIYPINHLQNFSSLLIGHFGYEHTYIICSKDKGHTWQQINADTLYTYISKFIYSLAFQNGNIYITNGKGIFKTSDWGESWNYVSGKFGYRAQIFSFDDILIASDQKQGVWCSNDAGRTWAKDESVDTYLYDFKINDNRLYAGDLQGNIYVKNNAKSEFRKVFNLNMGLTYRFTPMCCNAFIVQGLAVVFNENNIVKLPKIPTPAPIDMVDAILYNDQIIIVSIVNHGKWMLPFKFDLTYE